MPNKLQARWLRACDGFHCGAATTSSTTLRWQDSRREEDNDDDNHNDDNRHTDEDHGHLHVFAPHLTADPAGTLLKCGRLKI